MAEPSDDSKMAKTNDTRSKRGGIAAKLSVMGAKAKALWPNKSGAKERPAGMNPGLSDEAAREAGLWAEPFPEQILVLTDPTDKASEVAQDAKILEAEPRPDPTMEVETAGGPQPHAPRSSPLAAIKARLAGGNRMPRRPRRTAQKVDPPPGLEKGATSQFTDKIDEEMPEQTAVDFQPSAEPAAQVQQTGAARSQTSRPDLRAAMAAFFANGNWIPRWSWVDRWAAYLEPSFDRVARLRIVAAVCVATVAVLAFTPGFTTIPPVDRDESRYSQATRQMVNTGDYIDIRFQNEPRYKKPIGIYWLQSIAVTIYGAEDGQAPIWVYRTVSFVGAVASALLVYWLALAFGAPPVAFAAGLLVALTIMLGAEARLAKTDAVLFATILVAQGILARAFLGRRDSSVKPWHAGLFWTAAAAGLLVKGPILPMVVGSTAALACVFERRVAWLRRLRPGLGFMWMLILALPWFIAIGITSAGEFYALSIGDDFLEKVAESRERPFVPPGAYTFGFFPALGWPLAPLAFLAIPFAIASWHDKSTRFLVAWIVPTWMIFEFAATKLPHYILPIYPALAILAARMIVYEKVPDGWLAVIAKALFIAIPTAGVIGLPIVLFMYGDPIHPLGVLLTLLALISLVGAFLLLIRVHARASLILTVVGVVILYQGVFGFYIPAARTIWITPQLAAALDSVQCEDPELATLGYNEPSLVLMTRTDLRTLTRAEEAADFLADGACRAAFVEARFVPEMSASLDGMDPEAQPGATTVRLLSRVEGLNFNGGDELNMHVFASGE